MKWIVLLIAFVVMGCGMGVECNIVECYIGTSPEDAVPGYMLTTKGFDCDRVEVYRIIAKWNGEIIKADARSILFFHKKPLPTELDSISCIKWEVQKFGRLKR